MKQIQINPQHYLTFSTTIKTEGHNETHTIIPGSTLNGVMANRHYQKEGDLKTAYKKFHSGLVRFGQGHPVYRGQRCYPVPASWHIKKSTSATQQSGDALTPENILNLAIAQAPEGEQLVGQRDYFIYETEAGFKKLSFTIEEKPGIEIEAKKAKDKIFFINEQLHQHNDICYLANVDMEPSELPTQLQLGKRRNGEQGHVTIEALEQPEAIKTLSLKQGERLYLWLQTDLILCDQYGQPSVDPSDIGIAGLSWLKEQSFYRSDSRCRRNNYYYKTWLSDEHYIKAGAVLSYQIDQDMEIEEQCYLGLYNEYGFGEVRVNHCYVTDKTPSLNRQTIAVKTAETTSDLLPEDTPLTSWLAKQQTVLKEKEAAISGLEKRQKELKRHYKNKDTPSSTQWSHCYRAAIERDIGRLNQNEEIREILKKDGVVISATDLFTQLDNQTWITLQHYSHAAMRIARKGDNDEQGASA